MSYVIQYCIIKPSLETYNLFKNQDVLKEDVDDFNIESLVEIELPSYKKNGFLEGEGLITLIWTPYKYSINRISNNSLPNGVIKIENWLKENFDNKTIYRIDEILIENWKEIKEEEYWLNNEKLITEFLCWLKNQDTLHWQKIN